MYHSANSPFRLPSKYEWLLVLWQAFYSDFDTPLARCHTLWPGGTNVVPSYSSYDNAKSLEFCLSPFNQIA